MSLGSGVIDRRCTRTAVQKGYLSRKIVRLPPRYTRRKIKEKNEDAVRFSRRFNGSQNKGYLYAASLVGRKEGRK